MSTGYTRVWSALKTMFVKGTSDSNKRSRRRKNNLRKNCSLLGFETLEPRRVLTTFFLDANGSFWIAGTESADNMVAVVSGLNVRVTINSTSQERPLSQVQELVFIGRGGNDEITNHTFISSRLYGGAGNDTLTGGFTGDRLIGGPGNDTLIARGGNNIMIGSSGSNTIRGSVGNDIIRGGYGGQNTIYGGAGNDIIFAGDQGDEIFGEEGDDRIYGGIGNDFLDGGIGEDFLMGNAGDDVLVAAGTNNRLYGGSGNDILRTRGSNNQLWGQGGNDELYARGSNNFLYGGPGHDSLYGELASNSLYGGPGNDGLFGGFGSAAVLNPGAGENRILVAPGQPVPQSSVNDAVIQLVNDSSDWTFLEVEALDRGLRALHHRTDGTRVLKDTTSNDPLKIVKFAENDPALNGKDEWNFHDLQLTQNPDGTWTERYTREIRFGDFDESDDHQYRYAGLRLINALAHNWDSNYEINQVVPAGAIWNEFLSLSGWTTTNPNSSAYTQGFETTQDLHEYQIVAGNAVIPTRTWWYLNNSSFGRTYATANAKEDWAVSWELAFFDEVYGGRLSALNYTAVPAKVAKVNQLLAALG
jgi:hypothetical protein